MFCQSMDVSTLPYPPLSAQYKGSYAYYTVKDRLPIILTRVIDHLCREKNSITNSDEDVSEDLKIVIGKLSRLRSELQTNKVLQPLVVTSSSDFQKWKKSHCPQAKWFESPWLHVECYLYRFIQDIVEQSMYLEKLDVFNNLKKHAFHKSSWKIEKTAELALRCLEKPNKSLKNDFMKLLEIMLWGNLNDLSFSAGSHNGQVLDETTFLDDMNHLKENIIVNDSEDVWAYITSLSKGNTQLSIILDNGALELASDLCFAVFCTEHNIFSKVVFYVKRIPWFVSDVTFEDFKWTLEHLKGDHAQQLSEKCLEYLNSKRWEVVIEDFWTLPLPYSVMKKEDEKLYEKLIQNDLLIFKGDLNYRKLGGDLHWPATTRFVEFLRGFQPAPLLAVRTIKAEIVCGLADGKKEYLSQKNADWMRSGEYAVIQFAK